MPSCDRELTDLALENLTVIAIPAEDQLAGSPSLPSKRGDGTGSRISARGNRLGARKQHQSPVEAQSEAVMMFAGDRRRPDVEAIGPFPSGVLDQGS